MKILILNEMTQDVTENRIYDVIRTEYSNSEGYECDKSVAEDETFYYIDDDGNEGYDYRNIKTKECNVEGNDFEIFETDLEVAKYLVKKYNLNVEVIEK
jgi:hypothetical protein